MTAMSLFDDVRVPFGMFLNGRALRIGGTKGVVTTVSQG